MTAETPSARLRAAREARGRTQEQIANQVGLSAEWYYDLESHPDDVFRTVSLAHLQALCMALDIEPQLLLLGTKRHSTAPEIDFATLVDRLKGAMTTAGLRVEQFSEKVGWDLKDLLVDPQELWNFNLDGLKDVCAAARVDWLAVLAGLRW